jgi:ferritin-like metal-binding protein YciE
MADTKSLNDLFIENLRRAYDAEQRLVDALPELRDAATSGELKHAFQSHFEETKVHVSRIEQIFERWDEEPQKEKCKSIEGTVDDAKYARNLDADPSVKDAALIAAAQETEHVEIALYGTLRTWAAILVQNEAMAALEVTLEEEKAADELLTNIAATLNLRAAHAR